MFGIQSLMTAYWTGYRVVGPNDVRMESPKGVGISLPRTLLSGCDSTVFMKDSQNTTQLAVGMNGHRGFGGGNPHVQSFRWVKPRSLLRGTLRAPGMGVG
jgi:hypothetical protein